MTRIPSSDRALHAFTKEWDIVRYDRSGKWFVEWRPTTLRDHPGWVGPSHLGISVNRAGRAPVTVGEAAMVAWCLTAVHRPGVSGGSTFDRLFDRRSNS